MKPRELLAVLIALAALAGGVYFMFTAETSVVGNIDKQNSQSLAGLIRGLKTYSWAMGLALLGTSIAFILLGHENDLITTADEEGKK